MKKLFIVLLIISFIPIAQAAEKRLLIKQLTESGDVSTNNVASKLLSATIVPGFHTEYAILTISDGSTEKVTLMVAHPSAFATFGPFNRDSAPVFTTDIAATITVGGISGNAKASFVYIELE